MENPLMSNSDWWRDRVAARQPSKKAAGFSWHWLLWAPGIFLLPPPAFLLPQPCSNGFEIKQKLAVWATRTPCGARDGLKPAFGWVSGTSKFWDERVASKSGCCSPVNLPSLDGNPFQGVLEGDSKNFAAFGSNEVPIKFRRSVFIVFHVFSHSYLDSLTFCPPKQRKHSWTVGWHMRVHYLGDSETSLVRRRKKKESPGHTWRWS